MLSQNSVCMLPNAHEKPYDWFLSIYNFIFILLKYLAAPGLRCCGSHWGGGGPSRRGCRLWGLGRQKWHTGSVALQHVGSSWTRRQICVPCIGRWIHNHWTTREVPCDSFLSLTPKHPSSSHQLRKLNKLHGQSPLWTTFIIRLVFSIQKKSVFFFFFTVIQKKILNNLAFPLLMQPVYKSTY